MIRHSTGSIFDSRANALVNPVNCRGVMGKGLALAFAKRWPEIVPPYRRACTHGLLRPGQVFSIDVDAHPPRYVICVPTKDHWRDASKAEDIIAGLRALVVEARDLHLDSLAVPALGCGLGGLDWALVRPLMEMWLMQLQCDVQVYGPKDGGAS